MAIQIKKGPDNLLERQLGFDYSNNQLKIGNIGGSNWNTSISIGGGQAE